MKEDNQEKETTYRPPARDSAQRVVAKAPPPEKETKKAEKAMASNNSDPKVVGGIQPINCPQCGQEIKPLQSYHMNFKNERLHYPECYQRSMLGDKPEE